MYSINSARYIIYGVLLTFSQSACSTLKHFFKDTNTTPEDYDVIYTGDLGSVGTLLLYELMEREGYDLKCRHADCGLLIYDNEGQVAHAGGSGCGCSASILASFIMHRFESGDFKKHFIYVYRRITFTDIVISG